MGVLTLTDAQIVQVYRMVQGSTPQTFGLIMAAAGIGTMGVAAYVSKKSSNSAVTMIGIGSVGVGISFGCCAYFTSVHVGYPGAWFPILALFGGGFAGMVFVPFNAAAQKRIPEELTSRVFGVIGSVSTFATIAGPFLGGFLLNFTGSSPFSSSLVYF